MKKMLMSVAAAAVTFAAAAEMKIGTVDMLRLVRNHSSYEPNKKLLASTEEDYQKRIDSFRDELEKIAEEGRKQAEELRNPMLAQSAKTKLEKDIADVQQRFLAQQQRVKSEAMRCEQDLRELEARLLKAQAEDIRKQISRYAEANGYDLIVESAAALFAKKNFDVTDAVLKQMGVDPAKAKAADEGK